MAAVRLAGGRGARGGRNEHSKQEPAMDLWRWSVWVWEVVCLYCPTALQRLSHLPEPEILRAENFEGAPRRGTTTLCTRSFGEHGP